MADNSKCPKCGAAVAPTDINCMDCGCDLAIERSKAMEALRAVSISATRTGPPPTVAVANPAAAGIALGENSDETRLRVFDKQMAERFKKERSATLLMGIIAVVAGIVLLAMAFGQLKNAGGMDAIKALNVKSLRLTDDFPPGLTAVLLLGMGLGALLCGIGQTLHFLAQTRAIKQVEAGEKPDVVVMNSCSQVGMLVLAVFCPPFGIIVGILMKFSKDGDAKALGGHMILVSVGVVAILILNMIWGLVASHMPTPAATPAKS
jgi:hypothetical protein